jgi:hypothetical protein
MSTTPAARVIHGWLPFLIHRAEKLRWAAHESQAEAERIESAIASIRRGEPVPLNFLNATERRAERIRRAKQPCDGGAE